MTVPIHATTASVAATKDLAAALAELARPNDLVLLAGDLGAGKTAFAQGFGAALGVTDRITSPTFTIVSQYEGRLPLNHLDVYRLEQLHEVLDIGLAELLDEGGVTLIEWGDTVLPALPPSYLEVRITQATGAAASDDDRTFTLIPVGRAWQARQRAVTEAVRTWLIDRQEQPADAAVPADSSDPDESEA